ncbi:MAG: carboxypeptidase regulatory-like domain-containing protein, partial [Pyrinomonadaceae bacterium]
MSFLLATQYRPTLLVHAQTPTATLSGVVLDQNGAVVPGVDIAIINLAQGFQRQVTSDESGNFTVSFLPPGVYTIKAEHTGFAPAEVRDVTLNVNDRLRISIQLKVGSIGQTVDVIDKAPLRNDSTAITTLVDRQFVGNLPLNGRSFQSLIELTPGMTFTKTTSSNPGQFSVNGQRADTNYFTIDGVSANIGVVSNLTFGQSAGGTVPGLSATGGSNNLVSVDALQEFKVLTSTFAPEFGRSSGAQVSIATRSGTQDFHGALFEYFRNDVLDANDWFANAKRQPKPRERQNDFGGVIGGPILLPRFGEGGHQPWYNGRRGTFFFFSYEGLRLRQPQVLTTQVPSVTARQDAPAQIKPYLNMFSLPNGRDLGNGFAELNSSFSNPITLNATSIRFDHIVNQNVTLFGRFNYSPSSASQRFVRNVSTIQISAFKTTTLTIGSTFAFNPMISSDLRFNYSRNRGAGSYITDNFAGAVPLPDAVLFPPFATPKDSQFGFSLGIARVNVGKNVDNSLQQLNLVDTVSLLIKAHQLRFGIDYRRLSPTIDQGAYAQVAA